MKDATQTATSQSPQRGIVSETRRLTLNRSSGAERAFNPLRGESSPETRRLRRREDRRSLLSIPLAGNRLLKLATFVELHSFNNALNPLGGESSPETHDSLLLCECLCRLSIPLAGNRLLKPRALASDSRGNAILSIPLAGNRLLKRDAIGIGDARRLLLSIPLAGNRLLKHRKRDARTLRSLRSQSPWRGIVS